MVEGFTVLLPMEEKVESRYSTHEPKDNNLLPRIQLEETMSYERLYPTGSFCWRVRRKRPWYFKKKWYTKECYICGKEFKTTIKSRKTCCAGCSERLKTIRSMERRERGRAVKIEYICSYCYKKFLVSDYGKNHFCCSDECDEIMKLQKKMYKKELAYKKRIEYHKKYGINLREKPPTLND